jgi:transcription antitermination factor NusG
MELSADPNWYVIHTRSRSEKVVVADLVRRGIEMFLPMVTRKRRWRDRYKDVESPLFPGYCFARILSVERLKVLRCPHVVGILTFNGEPVPVDVGEIESIRTLVRNNVSCDPCSMLTAGDRVVVRRGPLEGAIGQLVRWGRRSRLALSVAAIGQAISVEVDADDVEKL